MNGIISIIIPFYDKDQHYIPQMLKYLDKLTFEKEVIFVDDRNDKTNTLDFPSFYKLVSSSKSGENVGTFEARRTGVMNASGKYVWFIDIDDEPFNFNTPILSNDKDLYYFNHILNCIESGYKENNFEFSKTFPASIRNNFNEFLSKPDTIINVNFSSPSDRLVGIMINYLFLSMTYAVWDKLFKRDTLIEVFKIIPTLINFKYGEDSFLVRMYLKYLYDKNQNINLQINTTPIYKYNLYSIDKYNWFKRREFFSEDTIKYTESLNTKYFKGTWLEEFVLFENDENICNKTIKIKSNTKKNIQYKLVNIL